MWTMWIKTLNCQKTRLFRISPLLDKSGIIVYNDTIDDMTCMEVKECLSLVIRPI